MRGMKRRYSARGGIFSGSAVEMNKPNMSVSKRRVNNLKALGTSQVVRAQCDDTEVWTKTTTATKLMALRRAIEGQVCRREPVNKTNGANRKHYSRSYSRWDKCSNTVVRYTSKSRVPLRMRRCAIESDASAGAVVGVRIRAEQASETAHQLRRTSSGAEGGQVTDRYSGCCDDCEPRDRRILLIPMETERMRNKTRSFIWLWKAGSSQNWRARARAANEARREVDLGFDCRLCTLNQWGHDTLQRWSI